MHFKKIGILVLCLLSCNVFANLTQLQSQQIQSDVSNALTQSLNCWNQGNLSCFMDGYVKSNKTLFISGTKFIYGWQKSYSHYQQKYGNSTAKMGQLKLDIKGIIPLDQTHAFVYGKYAVTINHKTYSGVTSLLFVKENKQWKIMVDHSN